MGGVRRIIRKKKKGRRDGDDDTDGIDPVLLEKVMTESNLPQAYSFEISKTVKRINQILQLKIEKQKQQNLTENETKDNTSTSTNSSTSVHIALQMPEGLLLYATVLSDVLQRLVIATNITTLTTQSTGNNEQLLTVSVLGD